MFTRRTRARHATPLAAIAGAALVALITLAAAACGTVNAPAGGAASATGRPASATPAPSAPSAPASVAPSRVPVPPPSEPVPVVPEKTACTGWPSVPSGSLPTSFVPVAVLRCVTGYTTIPGKGRWLTAILEKADQDLGPLAEALHAASGNPRPGEMCPQYVIIPPQIVLAAADGTMIRPRLPITDCGQIQHEVINALDALRWQTVSQRPIEKAPTPAAP